MQNVMRTPNPNIARRDDSEGPHERNRGTPRRARIGRSPMEDENSFQTEDRQNNLDQDGQPTITPNQHLRFYEGSDSREVPRGSLSPANLEDQIRSQIKEMSTQLRREIRRSRNIGEQMASGILEENYATNTEGSYPSPANLQEVDDTSMSPDPTAMLNPHILVDARSVPIANYKKATPISLLNAKEAKLSLDDRNPMQKIKIMNSALEASGFLTLVTGVRVPPIATINNPNGYRSKSVIMEFNHGKQVLIVIPEDDCYCFDSEKEATYYLLMLMIDQN